MTILSAAKNMLASEASASFSPYVLIGLAIAAASIFGTFKYQDVEIHKYHKQYDCVQSGLTCKDEKVVTIPKLQAVIAQMKTAQNTQTTRTETRIQTKIVTVPGPVQTVIKTISAAPKPANCGTPAVDILRNNT